MKYNIISSGSHGNCTIIDTIFMIDCGVPYSLIEDYGLIKYVFITHMHCDHINIATLNKLHEKYNITIIVANIQTYNYVKNNCSNIKILYKPKFISIYKLEYFDVCHDVECSGIIIFNYIIKTNLIYATDFSLISDIPNGKYDIAMIECNFDEDMIDDNFVSMRHNSLQNWNYWMQLNKPSVRLKMHKSKRNL